MPASDMDTTFTFSGAAGSPGAASSAGTAGSPGAATAASAGSSRAYLDWAATAPLDGRLRDAIAESSWGNPSSLHAEGRAARVQLEDARSRIAAALGAHAPSEVCFTSGGTESDNTALLGLSRPVSGAQRTHVVMSAIEHEAVLETAGALRQRGFVVDVLACDRTGVTDPAALDGLLTRTDDSGEATSLVAVQMLNNELGSIQPVRELAEVAHAHGALFFTDAVQALGKVEIALDSDGIDAASFSAHKLGALKGTGALYVKRSLRCEPLLRGGGQESGLRSGTGNVMGAHVFARAVELAVEGRGELWERALGWRSQVLAALASGGGADIARTVRLSADPGDAQAPHIISLLADGLEGETMVQRADSCGIALSAGSACGSGSREASHVLTAIGIEADLAYGALRISCGHATTQADIDKLVAALPEILR